ncbi:MULTISPECIES: DUF5130 family protein [Nocardia]|uniref:DUF5130 family protein n=1 Tax=Nocardia aurea TaxID=2144174 RepID=A0ABV3FL68_9NOCA|nr:MULTISPECIES: DUF5130 family protein [Nocardia]
MANSKWPAVVESDLPHGYALTSSGRVSGVHEAGDVFKEVPFSDDERLAIDNALTKATRATNTRFNVYIGDLGSDSAAGADAIFPATPDAARSVLIAVSPNDKAIEVRAGIDVPVRAKDRMCQLGATAARDSFKRGDLIDGLRSAIEVMVGEFRR